MKPLPDFVSRVQQVAKPDATILVTCQSGGRSAMAVNALAQWNSRTSTTSSMALEGNGNGDSDSVAKGGWKNSGCRWTKKLTPDRLVLPKTKGQPLATSVERMKSKRLTTAWRQGNQTS
jgi:hypothetical protein